LQLGAYAYSRSYLAAYAALPPSADEIALSHEMLRAPGLAPMRAHGARPGASVDAPEDLIAAERALSKIRANAPNTERQHRLQGVPA
jgi:CMP-2-keto-3-deoxyoctulosonic acid synthetase